MAGCGASLMGLSREALALGGFSLAATAITPAKTPFCVRLTQDV
jgi:hypothetical protein